MKRHLNVFGNTVEVPEIVRAKAEEAFSMIREENSEMSDKRMELQVRDQEKAGKEPGRRYLHFFKSQAAAAACVIAVAGAGITATAAGFHLWSRGMQGTIQATPQEQQSLMDQGVARTGDDSTSKGEDLSKYAVTENGITIIPDTVIVDDRSAHISFKIKGYDLPDGSEPNMGSQTIYLDSEKGKTALFDDGEYHQISDALISEGSFYDGTVPNLTEENGVGTYEDGSSFEFDENGGIMNHYRDENRDLEYVVSVRTIDTDVSLVGQTIHVDLENIGTAKGKASLEMNDVVEGNWNLTIPLPSVSADKTIEIGEKMDGTDFLLDDIRISPISIQLNYSSENTHEINKDVLGIPQFAGLILKDGTRYNYLAGSNIASYKDDTKTDAYESVDFQRVIDPDQVASLLIYPSDSGNNTEADLVEVSLDK